MQLLLAALIGLSLSMANASANTLAVLYPEAPAPYKQVFDQIIEGIDLQHKDRLLRYPLEKSFDPRQLLRQLENDRVDSVVTLGRRGFSFVPQLEDNYPYVSGALPLAPNGQISGVSLITDPNNLFEQLQKLSPATKRVFVVYSEHNRWLIDRARLAAKRKGLTLEAIAVSNLQDALATYKRILRRVNSGSDAIWLPLDKVTANEKVILPMLLREAWDDRLVLFSSKPLHVKRGVLFSIYPSNTATGVRLAEMIEQIFRRHAQPGIETSRSGNVGVNLRTASHLGLEFSPTMKRGFYRTFPQP